MCHLDSSNRYKEVSVNFDSLYSTIIYGSTTKPGFSMIMDDQFEHSAPSLVTKSVDKRPFDHRPLRPGLRLSPCLVV